MRGNQRFHEGKAGKHPGTGWCHRGDVPARVLAWDGVALAATVPSVMLEPCPLWHWPLPGPGHWVLAMPMPRRALSPPAPGQALDGPFLPAGPSGPWAHVPGRDSRTGWHRAPGWWGERHRRGFRGPAAGTTQLASIFILFVFSILFSCKRKGEKDEFLICKLISLITSN